LKISISEIVGASDGAAAPTIGANGGFIAPFIFFKNVLKLPRLTAVVSNFTEGGCAGAAGVGIKPPIGPFAIKNLQI
jgi:hypothetical protein